MSMPGDQTSAAKPSKGQLRFGLRGQMVVVAVVAIGLGLSAWMQRRGAHFRALYVYHINQVGLVSSPKPWPHEVRAIYHLAMGEKYRTAALRPWFPVAPDPPAPEGPELRLMPALTDVSSIQPAGKDLIILAAVNDALHFRTFDADGNIVVDTAENQLPARASQIAHLKLMLRNLWNVPDVPKSEKTRVITLVTSIVGDTQSEP
jgi:hypothetical protein